MVYSQIVDTGYLVIEEVSIVDLTDIGANINAGQGN